MAETSLLGAHQVQGSSGEMYPSSSSPSATSGISPLLDDKVPISDQVHVNSTLDEEAAATRVLFHESERLSSLEGTFLNAVSVTPSATGSTELGSSTSPVDSEPHHLAPSDSDDDILALNSFNLSLVSDNSVDDEFNVSGSLDTLLSSSPLSTSVTILQSTKLPPHNVSGLGISGLTRKDGSGPFDGLGIVSIKSPAWRHHDLPQPEIQRDGIDLLDSIEGFRRRPSSPFSSSVYDASSESEDFDQSFPGTGDRISDIFLQETLLTFTQDPFHELCHDSVISCSTRHSIPDCGNNHSWSELGLDDEPASTSSIISESVNRTTESHSTNNHSRPNNFHRQRTPSRTPKLNTNFSSATISSELKRSSIIIVPKSSSRNRSSSWPSSTTDYTSATPLTRCRWRL